MKFQNMLVFQDSVIPCFSIQERQILRLRKHYPDAKIQWVHDEPSFLSALPQAEIALTWKFESEWFQSAPCLKRIATPAAGHDFFPDVIPPTVQVRHGTFHGPIMAETLVGMMLAFNRGILIAQQQQFAGNLWPRSELYGSRLLMGTHAVILGFGHIGRCFGRLLKAFGVRITGVKRTPLDHMPEGFSSEDRVVTVDALSEVLPTADHLILILPNDTGTDRLVDQKILDRLPPHAVVYNLGRGNCIDEQALADALKSGKIRGACLDVFAKEPFTADSPLAENLPGLFRMPHASAFSMKYMDLFLDEVIEWIDKE